jgi:hypothetical protein
VEGACESSHCKHALEDVSSARPRSRKSESAIVFEGDEENKEDGKIGPTAQTGLPVDFLMCWRLLCSSSSNVLHIDPQLRTLRDIWRFMNKDQGSDPVAIFMIGGS